MYVQHFMKFHDPQPLKSKPFSFSIVFVHANCSFNPFAYLFHFLLNLLHLIFAIKKLVQLFESSKHLSSHSMDLKLALQSGTSVRKLYTLLYMCIACFCQLAHCDLHFYVFVRLSIVVDFIIISDVNGFCLNGNDSTISNRLLFGANFHRTIFLISKQ